MGAQIGAQSGTKGGGLKSNAKPSPRRNLIYVGQKPVDVYIHSILVVGQLGFETAQVQGLGRQCSKVISIVRTVQGLGKARIVDIENFQTDEGVQGIRVFLEFKNNRGRAQNEGIGLGRTPNAPTDSGGGCLS